MKKILLTLVLLGVLSTGLWAQEEVILDDATKELCNKVMMDIFTDIQASRDRFPELKYFDESVISKNKDGLIQLMYENPEYLSPRGDYHYRFALTVTRADDKSLVDPNGTPISFGFPVIGLKFAGYQTTRIRGRRYDLMRPIDKFGPDIYYHQQKYLKLKLIIEPEKRVYKVDERISFKVTLKNLTSQNLKVKPFNERTLFFTINDKVWGTQPESAKPGQFIKDEILYPTYSLTRGFKGDSFSTPGEVEIRCTFNMAFKGVLPIATLKLKIVPQ